MAVFEYKALNAKGRQTKGLVEADSLRAARAKLRLQGIFPTELEEGTSKSEQKGWNLNINFERKGVSISLLGILTRQLATLLTAGMPLVEALRALNDQLDHQQLRKVLAEITDEVNEGSTLATAFGKYPHIFPRIYTNMVASGEATGSLDVILGRLASLLDAQAALRRKIASALTYPTLMIVLIVGVIMILLGYVVPQITAIFAEKNAVLPFPTRIVIALSDVTKKYWWVVLASAIIGWFSFQRFKRTPKGRKQIDQALLNAPLVGTLVLKVATARFARNLASMLSSGIELLSALGLVKNIIGNAVLEDAVADAIEGVREGKSLASELNKSERFPRLLVHMIATGERSGQLEPMLFRAAESYEGEVDAVVSGLTSILEPVLIIVLAVIVGGILASIMLPMLEMTSLTG